MAVLFVYGTLRSEFDNRFARLLRAHSEALGPAVVKGSLYRIAHYPGYRPDPFGTVQGERYRLNTPEPTLRILDEYEGPEFERVLMEHNWIYQYRTQPPESARISSGDFCRP